MKTAEINELTTQELQERLQAARVAYDESRISHAVSPSENPAQLRKQRRDIARMATILRMRESQNN
ncbi:MAG: 50S ribosomal protein L29 [Porphyromonas sp.]|nr:50S ribosomal protein L29 [Porphyromonas sp.]